MATKTHETAQKRQNRAESPQSGILRADYQRHTGTIRCKRPLRKREVLILPYPVSVNRLWTIAPNARRIVPTREARDYKDLVRWTHIQREPERGPVSLRIRVYRPQRRGDLDNRLKVVLDALEGVCFIDDKQVQEIHATRHDDKHNPRVEVEVYNPMPGTAEV